jgi:hypothetical protein
MKARLRPWKEIISIFESRQMNSHNWKVHHSTNKKIFSGPHLTINTNRWPDAVIEIQKDVYYGNRQLYTDKESGSTYYDEWFEWIGEEPYVVKPLEDDLWDISDW